MARPRSGLVTAIMSSCCLLPSSRDREAVVAIQIDPGSSWIASRPRALAMTILLTAPLGDGEHLGRSLLGADVRPLASAGADAI
jgi:hypothetical protein